MPSFIVKLYNILFKYYQSHLLQSLTQASITDNLNPIGITYRPHESIGPSNPSFTDGVATKDIHVDYPLSSLFLHIFLPDTAVTFPLPDTTTIACTPTTSGGYSLPLGNRHRKKLPVMLQFHGGGFVHGSNESVANDSFFRRIAKLCDVIIIGVGYRLAPESKYPGPFEDGVKVLNWLAKQANMATCGRLGSQSRIFYSFGASMVEPWLAAQEFSRIWAHHG